MKVLEGIAREVHVHRGNMELFNAATRLGFDVGGLMTALHDRPPADMLETHSYVRFESCAWAVGITITIRFDPSEGPESFGYSAKCDLSWSATGRTVAEATHAVSLYSRAIEMAAIIEGIVR